VHPLLDTLRAHAHAFGPKLAVDACERGLAVTRPDGSVRAIPVTATPVILPEDEIHRRATVSSLISRAALKMARATLEGPNAEVILSALSPLERRVAQDTYAQVTMLATTRVDYFVAGTPFALEVNATIPAMQGYSDIAADAFIHHVGRHAGLDDGRIASLQGRNGSNTLALYRALLEGYAAQRDGRLPERIGLMCRRNDPQITEQRHLAQRFSLLGTEAEVLHPDELSGEGLIEARGRKWDLVYRHLFVRRLEETPSPFVENFFRTFHRWQTVLLNPPSAQVEVKTTFALLSRALVEPELSEMAGLEAAELLAVADLVPWTRRFEAGSTLAPGGERVEDLVAYVAGHPDRFVIKRSWDYGGKAVFVGRGLGTAQYEERVKAAYGDALDWKTLCERAASDPLGGGYVVQEYVESNPEPHLLCSANGVDAVELYVDYSAYATVGPGRPPRWGGVCRGSISPIVNIVGGGGVLPLLTTEVADALATAYRAQLPRRSP
jgi:hypothetical protein